MPFKAFSSLILLLYTLVAGSVMLQLVVSAKFYPVVFETVEKEQQEGLQEDLSKFVSVLPSGVVMLARWHAGRQELACLWYEGSKALCIYSFSRLHTYPRLSAPQCSLSTHQCTV